MPELVIARKINSFDEVVKASIIGKKKKFHNLIRTDMNDMINERDKYTFYGQDFKFSVELENDDMEAFIDNIHEYYENFDVDKEAYIWIGSDGHSKMAHLTTLPI